MIAGKMADDYLREHGIRPAVRFELDGIENISKLVSEGLGVSVLPDWPVTGSSGDHVKRWALPKPTPSRVVGAMWRRDTVREPLVRAFLKLVESS